MSLMTGGTPEHDPGRIHHVLLMCHRAEALTGGLEAAGGTIAEPEALAEELRRDGYQVTASRSPLDSKRLLEKIRPSVILLDPMVCSAEGIEFELAARVQTEEDPIPLIACVDELSELQELAKLPILFKDFLVKPLRGEELRHRIESVLRAKERHLAIRGHARKLEGEIITDFKTGLYTDRHFRHLLRQEFHRAERHRNPLSFLLIDIDDFKTINDRYEYSFGDHVLARFADILRHSIRDIDHAARFGGDEFMILLPSTTPAEAVQVAGRIRSQVSRGVFDDGTYQAKVTVSIGLDTYDGRGLASPEDLRRHANLALKEAKLRGKNLIWPYAEASGATGAEDKTGEEAGA